MESSRVRISLCLSIAAFLLAACDVRREWEEEVKLANGKTISVKRSSVRERIGEFGAQGYGRFKEEVVHIPGVPVEWRGNIQPVSVELHEGKAIVVGWFRGWFDCEKYGFPARPFAYFVSEVGGWMHIEVSRVPMSPTQNLLLNPWGKEMERHEGVVSLATKERLNVTIRGYNPFLQHLGADAPNVDHKNLLKCAQPNAPHKAK